MSVFLNALLTVLVFAALIGFAYAMSAISMSKKHKGLQVHPYMEMIPGRVGQQAGRESEIVPAPDFDLSKPEKEDPRRA